MRATKRNPAAGDCGARLNDLAVCGIKDRDSRSPVANLRSLARALNGEISGGQVLAPGPGHSAKDRSLSITLSADGKLIAHSFACDDWQTCRDYVRARLGLSPFKPGSEPQRRRVPQPPKAHDEVSNKREIAKWLWGVRKPVTDGCPAALYLRRRRGYDGPVPPTLCYLPANGKHPPAMIAAFGFCVEPELGLIEPLGSVTAVHLTRLTPHGENAGDEGNPAKIMLGAMSGLPIVLAPVNDGLGLAITEGIEDGLSEETGLGVWAAGSAGNMPKIAAALPPYVECVTIFAHRDEAGMRGAKEAARLITATGVEVNLKGARLTMAKGPDWNDLHCANPGAIRDAMDEPDILFDDQLKSNDKRDDVRGFSDNGEPPPNLGDGHGGERKQEQNGTAHVIDRKAPYTTAKLFLEKYTDKTGARTLIHHRSAFYKWNGRAYLEIADDELRSQIYPFLDQSLAIGKNGIREPVKPNIAMVLNVLDGLRSVAHLDGGIAAPVWLHPILTWPAEEIVACANGLLHLPSGRIIGNTPEFFTYNALDFNFDPDAPKPKLFLAFLRELWPDDHEAIATLQEIFGQAFSAFTVWQHRDN
jgi:hypothetical protein